MVLLFNSAKLWQVLYVELSMFLLFQAPVKAAPKQKIAKPMKVSAPRVGGKRWE